MKSKILILVLLAIMSITPVFADDLNGVGTTTNATEQLEQNAYVGAVAPIETQETQETEKSVGDLIGDAFEAASVDAESMNKANQILFPIAKAMNFGMAILLASAFIGMSFITVLDLVYIAFPPVRDLLDGGKSGMANMQGGRSMNMGGMGGFDGPMGSPMSGRGGGMGMGMGMNRQPQQQQSKQLGGGLSAIGRWVSDEAIAACIDNQGGPMGATSMGQSTTPIKSMVFSYFKLRSMFLFLYAACVMLLTSTVFTDLGIAVGIKLLGMLTGLV